MMTSQHRKTSISKVLRRILAHLVLLVGACFFMMPLVFLVSTSLKASRQIAKFPPDLVPNPWIWRNYPDVFFYVPMQKYFVNTLRIVVPAVFGATLPSALAAYGFARVRAPGRDFMFGVLLTTMMLPGIVTLIPLYIIFSKIGWVGTFRPLIIPVLLGSPFYIFLLRQFFMTIPTELEDAALIDGCGRFRIWYSIMLPLAKPALATVAVFAFMGAWNDYMGPLIYLGNRDQYTLSLGLQVFVSNHGSEWGMLMAASTMMVLPVIVLFFFAQKSFIQGITMTGIKG
jgi:multiple sugar transport system permease protein